jgi:hypothetical protein
MIRNGVVVMLENDERAHDWIETVCDVKRMAEVFETIACGGNTLPVVFIRFNPHDFHGRKFFAAARPEDAPSERVQNPTIAAAQIMHMFYSATGFQVTRVRGCWRCSPSRSGHRRQLGSVGRRR